MTQKQTKQNSSFHPVCPSPSAEVWRLSQSPPPEEAIPGPTGRSDAQRSRVAITLFLHLHLHYRFKEDIVDESLASNRGGSGQAIASFPQIARSPNPEAIQHSYSYVQGHPFLGFLCWHWMAINAKLIPTFKIP